MCIMFFCVYLAVLFISKFWFGSVYVLIKIAKTKNKNKKKQKTKNKTKNKIRKKRKDKKEKNHLSLKWIKGFWTKVLEDYSTKVGE